MGSVRRRRSGLWQARLRDRWTKRQICVQLPADVRTERQARKAMETLQMRLDNEWLGLSPKSGPSWLAMAGEILEEIATEAGESWFAVSKATCERFAQHVGDVPVGAVTTDDCRCYVRDRRVQGGASPSTLRKEFGLLKRIFQRAVDRGLIQQNPWAVIKKPPEPPPKDRALEPCELRALLAAAPPDRRFRWLFLISTGAERKQAMALKWSDVDLSRRQLRLPFRQKGRVPRQRHYFVPIAAELFAELRKRQGAPGEPIFSGKQNWRRDFRLDAHKAGLSDWRSLYPKVLRHTFGTLLGEARCSPQEIQKLMGLRSIVSAMKYVHLSDDQHEAAKAINGALAKPPQEARVVNLESDKG